MCNEAGRGKICNLKVFRFQSCRNGFFLKKVFLKDGVLNIPCCAKNYENLAEKLVTDKDMTKSMFEQKKTYLPLLPVCFFRSCSTSQGHFLQLGRGALALGFFVFWFFLVLGRIDGCFWSNWLRYVVKRAHSEQSPC